MVFLWSSWDKKGWALLIYLFLCGSEVARGLSGYVLYSAVS